MFISEPYNTYENSLSTAKTLAFFEQIYETFRNFLGKIVLLSLLFLVTPLVFLLGYLIKSKRKALQRHMRKDIPGFKNSNEYQDFKMMLDKFENLLPSLNKINEFKANNAPLTVRYFLIQLQKMASTLITYFSWLKKGLSHLNAVQFTSKSNEFKLVSEQELWKNRNQSYHYWL